MLSVASFMTNDQLKFGLLGGGIAAATVALLARLLLAFFGRPPKR